MMKTITNNQSKKFMFTAAAAVALLAAGGATVVSSLAQPTIVHADKNVGPDYDPGTREGWYRVIPIYLDGKFTNYEQDALPVGTHEGEVETLTAPTISGYTTPTTTYKATWNGMNWVPSIDLKYTKTKTPSKPANPTPKKPAIPATPAKPKTPQKTASSVTLKGIVKVTASSTTVYTAPGGKATSQVLKQGTRWQVTHYEIIDGQKWYQVGTNQWVLAGDAAVEGKSSDVSSLTETKLRAVAKVTYKGAGSVRLLDRSGHYQNSYVKKQTSWKVFAQATINGKLYYRLGNQRQWIPAQYVKLTRA